MTDTTEKDVLMNGDSCGWSDEELDAMIIDDEFTKMKGIKCVHIANVPDWIVGEFAGENKALGIETECPKCMIL